MEGASWNLQTYNICRVREPDDTVVQEDKQIQMNTVTTNFYNVHEDSAHLYEVIPDCVSQSEMFGRDEVSSCPCMISITMHTYLMVCYCVFHSVLL